MWYNVMHLSCMSTIQVDESVVKDGQLNCNCFGSYKTAKAKKLVLRS